MWNREVFLISTWKLIWNLFLRNSFLVAFYLKSDSLTNSYNSGRVLVLTKFCVVKLLFQSWRKSGWNHSGREWYKPNFKSVFSLTAAAKSPKNIHLLTIFVPFLWFIITLVTIKINCVINNFYVRLYYYIVLHLFNVGPILFFI